MLPGSSYTDELIIENGTSTTYRLFFKVIEKNQSDVSNNLLDYINMKIYLDDSLIYDGKVKGLDYNNNGVNLQEAIEIGDFPGGRRAVMKAETTLSTDYNNPEDNDFSEIDWQFYAEYDEKEEPTPDSKPTPTPDSKPTIKPIERDVPKKTPGKVQTGMLTNVAIYSIVIGVSALILFVILYLKRYNNKEIKNRKKRILINYFI